MVITEVLDRAKRLYHKRTAFVCGDTTITYGEFYDRASRLGSALQGLGIDKGERVALLMLNCHRQIETYFATFGIGGVVVPINARFSPSEIPYIVNDSEARVLVVDDALLPLAEAIRPGLETVKHFVHAGDYGMPQYMLKYEELVAGAAPMPTPVAIEDNTLAGIFYTGGTTGTPKGAMLSHHNLMADTLHFLAYTRMSSKDVWLHAAPLFHIAACATMFVATECGIPQVIMKLFIPDVAMQMIERHKITITLLIPAMLNWMINHPDYGKYDLSSLRAIGYGASPMPLEVLRKAMQTLPCQFGQAYGMTEASPMLTFLGVDDHVLDGPPEVVARLASAGQPSFGVEVRVVNEKGEDVKPGEVGEVIARGPNIMLGYWKRPEDTAEAIRDGWYYSGDMATVDDEFYLYIVDRRKDMIISGGENIYSIEVENVLYKHPAILEATVIGVPDEKWGEAVKAVCVLKPGESATAEEIIAHCKQHLASYKAPKSVDFVESLPKSGAGKILKREVREPYWRGHNRRVH